ncbi:ATP-binding protein [Burkholderia cepacia]|uniref:ATP-binding protein n=1 Tax=Burkholderia cepacia TaxID=292 RepID=UPI001FC7F169|nr:DUF87 domain-containing protein [Burkholderia cepacia]
MNLLQYMPITARVRRNLEQKQLSTLMLKSGLPAVESVIDEYIDKYNFPHRVKRAYDAMMHAIVSGLNEAEVNRQLDLDETMLRTIEQQIVVLKANQEKGFEVNEFRERMIREGLRMPAEIEKKLQALENCPRVVLRDMAKMLTGEVTVATAESTIEMAEKTLRAEFNALINAYENEFEHCQGWISRRLQEEYQSRIAALFADCGALNLPVFDSFLKQAVDMSVDLAIRSEENRVYQALILAEPLTSGNLDLIRSGYEQVATQLSPLLKQHVTFGQQDSDSLGFSISQGLSESLGESLALTETRGTADTTGISTSNTRGSSTGTSTQSTKGKLASFLGPVLGGVGALAGGPAGAIIGAQIGGSVAALFNEQHSEGTSHSVSESSNESRTVSTGESASQTRSRTDTSSVTDTRSQNRTVGASRQIAIESTDKTIGQLIARIDHHLERIDEAKTYGGWNSAAYFIGDSVASSESLASVFLGLIRGSKSSHEDFALTTWRTGRKQAVVDWLSALSHPRLHPDFAQRIPVAHLTPATLVSGKEMAIQLGLPRRSTSTVAVVETQTFGRRVQRLDGTIDKAAPGRTLTLGNVRHLWENLPQTIELNLDQLSSHVFVSGSTGAGKSNTLYAILDQLRAARVPFLVIEPAKGEYKHVFGQADDVTVLGTHPVQSALLRINPFRFPEAIHVLEHVDRLVEIFNVCWPMYAAMPAVLKDAILHAYTQCGWDLSASTNRHHHALFPTFADLLEALEQVLADSAWSQELKGNYLGSLATRIRSLTNGLNGHLFSADEIDSAVLFDSNVIVDQSPHAVDIAAIRNTNTKIILRLPEETDRRLIGRSIALRDEQLDEIARLPRGVAMRAARP